MQFPYFSELFLEILYPIAGSDGQWDWTAEENLHQTESFRIYSGNMYFQQQQLILKSSRN